MTISAPRRHWAAAALLAVAALTMTACATPHEYVAVPPDGVPTPSVTTTFGEGTGDRLVIRYGDDELQVAHMDEAMNYDPAPSEIPAITADELFVFVRPAGWLLFAEQLAGDPVGCGEVVLEPTISELGGGWWSVSPVGPAATYTLRIGSGSGPGLPFGGETGSLDAYVAWTTETDVPMPDPVSTLDITAVEGETGSVELYVHGMSTTPASVDATVTMTGDSGRSVTAALEIPEGGCDQPGDLYLRADLSQADAEAIAGDEIAYDLTLTLDDVDHAAEGALQEETGSIGDPVYEPALP